MIALIKTFVYLALLIHLGYAGFSQSLRGAWQRRLSLRPAWIAVAMTGVALILPALWLVYIAFFALPLLFIRTPAQIGPVYLSAYLLSPELHDTLSAGGIPLIDYSVQISLSLGTLAALAVTRTAGPKAPFATVVPALVMAALMLVIAARDTTATNWLRQLVGAGLAYALPAYVLSRTIRRSEDLTVLLVTLVGIGCVLSTIGLFETVRHWPLYTAVEDHLGMDRSGLVVKMRGGMIRARGPMSDQTDLGFVLVICLAAALAIRPVFRSAALHAAVVALLALGTLAPQSRGAMIGAALVFVLVPLYRRGAAGAAPFLLAIPVAGTAFWFIRGMDGAVARVDAESAGTLDYRSQLLSRGLSEFARSPLFGDTYANILVRLDDMKQGEGIVDLVNTYLYFALLTGAVGLIAFVAILCGPVIRAVIIRPRLAGDPAQRDVAAFATGAILAAAAMLTFTSLLPRGAKLTLFVLVIAMAVGRMRSAPRARGGPAPDIAAAPLVTPPLGIGEPTPSRTPA